jgi:hypothetical protein
VNTGRTIRNTHSEIKRFVSHDYYNYYDYQLKRGSCSIGCTACCVLSLSCTSVNCTHHFTLCVQERKGKLLLLIGRKYWSANSCILLLSIKYTYVYTHSHQSDLISAATACCLRCRLCRVFLFMFLALAFPLNCMHH